MSKLSRLTVPMCGFLAASTALAAIAFHAQAAEVITGPAADPIDVTTALPAPVEERADVRVEEALPPITRADPRQYGFVIAAGGASYVQLTTDTDEIPSPRGRARLVDVEGVESAIAPVAADQVPTRLADWIGKRVLVDGTCATSVVGFAKIARLTGETNYAGIPTTDDGALQPWTGDLVMKNGAPMLAAKLGGCTGTWARDAALPPAVHALPLLGDARLAAAARADLLGSEAAEATQAEWHTMMEGDFRASTDLVIDTREVLHPLTAQRWVFVRASVPGEGCGGPHVNLMGVYRVGADGALVRTALYSTDISSLDDLIDVDGDGRFELRTMSGFVSDPALLDLGGTQLSTTSVPFFGCPC